MEVATHYNGSESSPTQIQQKQLCQALDYDR